MYSFKESSTCEYEVIILSPTLCNHPDYRPEESTENLINCKPTNEKSPTKPKQLQELEEESQKLRSEKMFQGNFMQGNKPGEKPKKLLKAPFGKFVTGHILCFLFREC